MAHSFELTAARLRELLTFQPDTGLFTWKATLRRAGSVNGSGYVQIKIDGRIYLAHRLVVLFVEGVWPSQQVDHIDGDRQNNRPSNLRQVSAAANSQNRRRARCDSSTGFLGVERSGSGFQARITIKGKKKGLGSFETAVEAHQVYLLAKRERHEGCTI